MRSGRWRRSTTTAICGSFWPMCSSRGRPFSSTASIDSRRIFAEVGTEALLDERQEIERLLKSSAVELMTDGADVRGLAANAVPLVAYSLFRGNLPVSSDAASSATVEKINNLLLGLADELSEEPRDTRLLLISLFRLTLLLGEAQEYADKLSLTTLSLP